MKNINTFKDKRYWMLVIPTAMLIIILAVFTPDFLVERPYLVAIIILVFWTLYYSWTYFGNKKKRKSSNV